LHTWLNKRIKKHSISLSPSLHRNLYEKLVKVTVSILPQYHSGNNLISTFHKKGHIGEQISNHLRDKRNAADIVKKLDRLLSSKKSIDISMLKNEFEEAKSTSQKSNKRKDPDFFTPAANKRQNPTETEKKNTQKDASSVLTTVANAATTATAATTGASPSTASSEECKTDSSNIEEARNDNNNDSNGTDVSVTNEDSVASNPPQQPPPEHTSNHEPPNSPPGNGDDQSSNMDTGGEDQ
jgi:hypothetical protein